MTLSSRSLTNSTEQSTPVMQISLQDKVERYLEKKFRTSRSFSTKNSYRVGMNRFIDFLRVNYNQDITQILRQIKETNELDPINLLDEYFSFLSNEKKRLANSTIRLYLIITKDFLNSEGCKIYNEDLNQRFRFPKRIQIFEEGLTKETINRIIRFSNPKLATIVLMICSSGMRIAEVVQLHLSDVDLSKNPTTVKIRAETTKSRQTRITCIGTEASKALQDYLKKFAISSGFIFLKTHEQKISELKSRLERNSYVRSIFRNKDKKRLATLELEIKRLSKEELYAKSVITTRHSLENQLSKVIENIPDLSKKNENGRNSIHFHAFRAWFKTQVTDAHQSDFAEALMGHKSLKLIYYRQNEKARAQTYQDVEYSITIADTEKIDQNYSELQKDNLELRGIVDNLSKQLRDLEKRIEKRD